jgi:hypothetical protein
LRRRCATPGAGQPRHRVAGRQQLRRQWARLRDLQTTELDTALLLSAESYRTEPTRESRQALLDSLLVRIDIVRYLLVAPSR